MYWPIGTPRAYATCNNRARASIFVSHDGIPSATSAPVPEPTPNSSLTSLRSPGLLPDEHELPTPVTPLTPATPAVQPVEQDEHDVSNLLQSPLPGFSHVAAMAATKEPILALQASRNGHLFAVITSTTVTIWQTKPMVVLAVVVRSEASLETYGKNIDLLLRPDTAIFVVHTSSGYLITYSMATDTESRVYKPHFPSYHNVQRRRHSHAGGPGGTAPDQFLWGPGEGAGVRDISVRFRMVIKVDAGIESALALEDELVVATQKPAAVQCIRWSPDSTGKQTRTELISRMGWLEKKMTVSQMTYDRPMNLLTWVTTDGRAYAVQRIHTPADASDAPDHDPKKLFKGHCFYIPESNSSRALYAVINARFSLIAVGCANGVVRVFAAKDYSGNIPASHSHNLPVTTSVSGPLTTLSYSSDGYCLFAGFERGWATWSVYGTTGSHSFNGNQDMAANNQDQWLVGVSNACWVGGSSELLLTSRQHDAVWALEMARSAVSGCYTSSNIFRTVLQTSSSVSVYRGYDLPDLTSISAEPFLWHTSRIPPSYLLHQWPIKCTAISPDGRYIAVAGRRGLAHYSINSGRWKTFGNPEMENEFQIRGGMCWYQHILVAAVETENKSHELRLFSRETALDNSLILHTQHISAPIVLVTSSGEDSVLVYTHENLLYHFIFAPQSGSVRLVQVGQIAFHDIVRSPARVRGLSWILPESQLAEGDPTQDVGVASVLFLVDGKLVMLRPSLGDEGLLKYDMRVIAQNVEFHANMRDEPFSAVSRRGAELQLEARVDKSLRNSLWVYDGNGMKVWPDVQPVLQAISGEGSRDLPTPVYVPTDFYPLSMLLDKAIVLGVESDLVQRRDVSFSYFRFSIRTHLFIPDILRFYLTQNMAIEALRLAQQYQDLEYFPHALEVLLHHVLDDEVDSSPTPEQAILPRVLSLLSSFKEYLDIVLQCTRKTEVRQWRTLFAYLPPVQELFEESLQRGSLKTAGGYLIILHTLDEAESVLEQSVRLLSGAIREEDWELCKELARFLAALDETGDILKETMEAVNVSIRKNRSEDILTKLELPPLCVNGELGETAAVASGNLESDDRSPSDAASFGSSNTGP